VTPDLTRRRSLLTAALAAVRVKQDEPELAMMHRWLHSGRGLGDVVTGMARQDDDVALTRFDGRGWRATFYVSGMEHSPTNATGTAFEPTPWRAVQVAAWEALKKTAADDQSASGGR
jgi:hypothetical protein